MKLISVNVGLPRSVNWQGKKVQTSIWKDPVVQRIRVSKLNLEGDRQSDLSVRGAIVNMASLAGLNGVANLAAYVAGKAGIIGLTKVAALDYADRGIRVNVVAPGPILTHHLEKAGIEAQRQAAAATPMKRIGRAEEVAATVLWLCSDQSSFITGAVIPIDGGQYAGLKPPSMFRPGKSED